MTTKAKWTFMLYLAGDNNLSLAGETDIGEMRKVGSTKDVNVIVEFDRAGANHETKRYRIEKGGAHEREMSLGETDSGDPKVLQSFVDWAAREYPADRYALVLWNHGGGWVPDDLDSIARSVGTKDYNLREARDRAARSTMNRVLFRTTVAALMRRPTALERAICCDDGSLHSIDTVELGKVLSYAAKKLGKPLDLLGMDACLMSNLEVAYQAKAYVKYIVASEENEPNNGWPYDSIFAKLVADPTMPTVSLAKHIVQDYAKSYAACGFTGPVTQSALDLANIGKLTKPLDELSKLLVQRMAAAKYELGEALFHTKGQFYDGTLWDVAEVCAQLASGTADNATRKGAAAVLAALHPKSNLLVRAQGHLGSKVKKCGGLSVYLPPRAVHGVSKHYAKVAFAKDHQWDEMLAAYHAP